MYTRYTKETAEMPGVLSPLAGSAEAVSRTPQLTSEEQESEGGVWSSGIAW